MRLLTELEAAVKRGVVVRALVAHTNRGGDKRLRKLELDKRREVGLIIRDRDVVRRLQKIFDRNWRDTTVGEGTQTKAA